MGNTRFSRSYLCAICGTLFVLATALSASGAQAAWNVEVVQTHDRETLPWLGLAYDSAGTPSIAYGDNTAGELRLATRTGSGWSVETVSTLSLSNGIRHAYDGSGKPVVLFIAKASGPGNFNLYYAEKVSGSWQSVRIDRRVRSAMLSFAFSAGNTPSIVYLDGSEKLIFATRPGSEWVKEVVLSGVSALGLSLAYNDSGAPVISYIQDQHSLKLASKSGSSWNIETVTTETAVLGFTDLAFDPTNGETVIQYRSSPCGIHLARKSGGFWQFENGPSDGLPGPRAFAFDASGTPYVSYYNCVTNTTLSVARKIAGSWSAAVVDSSAFNYAFSSPVIRIDGDGNPAVAYPKRSASGAPSELRFAGTGAGCSSGAECDDGNECTIDTCVDQSCQNVPLADNSSCNGGAGICCSGSCTAPVCTTAADCDDSDICTDDSCFSPNVCSAYCDNVFDITNDPSCDACVPTHSKEKGPRCNDGLDNDCDSLIDADDPDCW